MTSYTLPPPVLPGSGYKGQLSASKKSQRPWCVYKKISIKNSNFIEEQVKVVKCKTAMALWVKFMDALIQPRKVFNSFGEQLHPDFVDD
jgi:hypothetical protein